MKVMLLLVVLQGMGWADLPPRDSNVETWYTSTTPQERLYTFYGIQGALQFMGSVVEAARTPEQWDQVVRLIHSLSRVPPQEAGRFLEQVLKDPTIYEVARDKHVWYFLFLVLRDRSTRIPKPY